MLFSPSNIEDQLRLYKNVSELDTQAHTSDNTNTAIFK